MSLRLFFRLCLGFYLGGEIGRIPSDDVSDPLIRVLCSCGLSDLPFRYLFTALNPA